MRKPTPLKLAIVASGRSQRELAEAIGCDDAQLSRWANGLHCAPARQEAIAAALGRTVEELWPGGHGPASDHAAPDSVPPIGKAAA